MNVGINLVKYPQFLLLEFQKCANLQFIKTMKYCAIMPCMKLKEISMYSPCTIEST